MGNDAPRLRDDNDPVEEVLRDTEKNHVYYHEKKSDVRPDATETDLVIMTRRWKNRRRMAWLSLIAMFVMTFMVFFTDLVEIERMKVLKEVITWFYFACISVVGAYMGFTTWASKR